jgi:deoxyribonuclease V
VVGVAKTRFEGAPAAEVLRGRSARPLFVSAIGLEVELVADLVRGMHGADRRPTLLAAVDRACRDA